MAGVYCKFRSTLLPADELHPYKVDPGFASIVSEVVVPRYQEQMLDPLHCCRLYVVNQATNRQRMFLCEGFSACPAEPQHTTLQDLWEIVRTNPGFMVSIAASR